MARPGPSGRPAPVVSPRPRAVVPGSGRLVVGDLLADRYRLLEELPDPGTSVAGVFRAQDEVLARPVAVTCVATPNRIAREAAQPFLDAAARLGGINHAGVARVYDAALEARPGRGNDLAYVISEWVEGETLDVHLQRVGALAGPDATDVLRQVADALTALHNGGLVHGRVHPRNVLVTPAGRVRLTDAAVATTLVALERDVDTDIGVTPSGIIADTRDLAAVLYALTTARWPAAATPQPAGALPPAPVDNGQVLTARQQRASVPKALDTVITRGLDPARVPALGPLRSPTALADAADAAVADVRAEQLEQEREKEPKPPGLIRRALPWVASLIVIGAVGVVGWVLGLAVGDLPPRADSVDAIVSSPEPAAPGAKTYPPIALLAAQVRDFDPLGKDHSENPDQVPNAIDNDTSTAWSTSRYKTADFSGLKTGVGLLIDLRKQTALHTAAIGFTAKGAHVQVYASATEPKDVTSMKLVAEQDSGGQVASRPLVAGTTARYVVIWITQLPKTDGAYQVGISELRLT